MTKAQFILLLMNDIMAFIVLIVAIIVAVITRKKDSTAKKVLHYVSLGFCFILGIYCSRFAIGWYIDIASVVLIAVISIAIYKRIKK